MSEQNILMILPRKTIPYASPLRANWQEDADGDGITIYEGSKPLGHARWQKGHDFSTSRPVLQTFVLDEKMKSGEDPEAADELYQALISRLALAYDAIPGKYPLYMKTRSNDLQCIARASRIGLIPYFGEWKEADPDESARIWEEITTNLKAASVNNLI